MHYAPHYPIDVQALEADFLLCSAYKFYGPHIGVLCARPGALEALAADALSTQEPGAPHRIETGTLNHEGIAGTLAAVEYIESLGTGDTRRERIVSAMSAVADYEHALAEQYYDRVSRIPGVKVWGPDFSKRRTPTVSISLDGITPSDAAKKLSNLGLCAWDGDFYAERAIEILGLKENGGVLRVGISLYNTEAEVNRLLAAIENLMR